MKKIIFIALFSFLGISAASAQAYNKFECGGGDGIHSVGMYYVVDLENNQFGYKQVISGDWRSHQAEPIFVSAEIKISKNVKTRKGLKDKIEVFREDKNVLTAYFNAGVLKNGATDVGEDDLGVGGDGERALLCVLK